MDLILGWPQIIMSALIIIKAISNINLFAKSYEKSNSSTRVGFLLGIVTYPILWFGLLYWGGFYTA